MSPKRYCQLTAGIALAALALIVATNLLVDPLGAYRAVDLQHFAKLRGTVATRRARAELARQGDWDMIILGTSRPRIGMPADHPAFASNHVCNLSVDAALMSEARAIFDYARVRNPLKRVLLCLDVTISRQGGAGKGEFAESRFNPKLSLFDYHCENLLGAPATDLAFKFLLRSVTGDQPPAGQRNGFHVRSLREGAKQRSVFDRTMRSLAASYAMARIPAAEMDELRHVIAACREQHIELTLAINPTHALDLELLRLTGGWERFEAWKREVLKMTIEEAAGEPVRLWDFSGYWMPTMEPVPVANDSTTRMKYYFENSHYTPLMGALMLDRIYGGATTDFGVVLTPSNIEAHIASIRAQRERYVKSNAADVAWVEQVAKGTLTAKRKIIAAVEEIE